MSSSNQASPGGRAVDVIRNNWRHLQDLPEPPKSWKSTNQNEWVRGRPQLLHLVDIIKRAEKDDDGDWILQRSAYEEIQERAERASQQDGPLPCGCAPGWTWEDGMIVCKRCETPYDPEKAKSSLRRHRRAGQQTTVSEFGGAPADD